jgi:hypothetical protein
MPKMNETSSINWHQLLASGLLSLAGFVLGLIFSPIKQWAEAILWRYRICIKYYHQVPYFYLTKVGLGERLKEGKEKTYDCCECRFLIQNRSRFRIVRGCRVKLTAIWHIDNTGNEIKEERFEPLHLAWTGKKPADLPPRASIFASLVRIAETSYQKLAEADLSGSTDKPQLRLNYTDELPRWMPSNLDIGKHRLLGTIFFADQPPINRKFEIDWSGEWRSEYRLMKKELLVRDIT